MAWLSVYGVGFRVVFRGLVVRVYGLGFGLLRRGTEIEFRVFRLSLFRVSGVGGFGFGGLGFRLWSLV